MEGRGHLGSGAGVRLAVPLRGVELAGYLQAVARQEAQALRPRTFYCYLN